MVARLACAYVRGLFVLEVLLFAASLLLHLSVFITGTNEAYVAFGLPLFRATVIVWIPMAVFIKDSLKWTDQIRSCPKWMWKTALAFGLYGIFIAVLQAVFPQGDSFSEQALTVSGFPLGFDAIALCILCSVLRSDCMEKSEVVRRATLSIVLATVGVILFLAYRAGYLHHLGPTE